MNNKIFKNFLMALGFSIMFMTGGCAAVFVYIFARGPGGDPYVGVWLPIIITAIPFGIGYLIYRWGKSKSEE